MTRRHGNSPKHLELVTQSINRGDCIFFLGPNIQRFTYPESYEDGKAESGQFSGDNVQKYFLGYMEKNTGLELDYDESNLLHFSKKLEKFTFQTYVKKFYLKHSLPSFFLKSLARIPIPLFINFSPDSLFNQAFEEQGLDYSFQFFNKDNPLSNSLSISPSKELPVVYNLFGSIDEPDSLILEHEDLFSFLFSLIQNQIKIPEVVLQKIFEAKVFVFLGFEFNYWYLRMILRYFESQEKLGLASGNFSLSESLTQSFYSKYFEIEFISSNATEYVRKLYDHFENKNELRVQASRKSVIGPGAIVSHLEKDELAQALQIFKSQTFLGRKDTINEVVSLAGWLNLVENRKNSGVMTDEEYSIQRNSIRKGILNLFNQIQANSH